MELVNSMFTRMHVISIIITMIPPNNHSTWDREYRIQPPPFFFARNLAQNFCSMIQHNAIISNQFPGRKDSMRQKD